MATTRSHWYCLRFLRLHRGSSPHTALHFLSGESAWSSHSGGNAVAELFSFMEASCGNCKVSRRLVWCSVATGSGSTLWKVLTFLVLLLYLVVSFFRRLNAIEPRGERKGSRLQQLNIVFVLGLVSLSVLMVYLLRLRSVSYNFCSSMWLIGWRGRFLTELDQFSV